ncbi:MAG: sulfite exporter TauE/SafE family protein [Chloroflexi bacterium]|nr:sulfite exporter TauE/SafE family protein [Chloroflexota bacterium]
MNWTAYWFMFPVALGIAILANATGIEGATFFSPVFILILRLDPRIAIGTALITEVFGFGSGVSAYVRRKLIDYRLAGQLLLVTVPLALAGAYFARLAPPVVLKSVFGVGLLIIGINFLRAPSPQAVRALDQSIRADFPQGKAERRLQAADGQEYSYTVCNSTEGGIICGVGGLFMGLIGSGQGELNGYFLLRRCRVPSKVAVATGALVVAATALAASLGYFITFVRTGGDVLAQVLSLVIYTVPGVILGGQFGPALAARLDAHKTERMLAILFLLIGVVTLWTTLTQILA